MDIFKWDKNFETGLPEIDRQHQGLADLINRCGKLLIQDRLYADDLDGLFTQLFSSTEQHFQAEESLMASLAIDKRHQERHIKEHADFLLEIDFMQKDIGLADNDCGKSLLQFHNNWLAYHLLGYDKSLSRQIAAIKAGLSTRKAFENEEKEANQSTRTLLAALSDLFQQASLRNRQLVEMNRTLEAKVNERTLALSEANRNFEELAMTDALTNLPNRRHAMRRLKQLWKESVDSKTPLSCMMIDADGFKSINDHFGHDAGDSVLYELARRLSEAVRSDDIVCRLGGDEFLVICPATPLKGAMHVAELVRKAVAHLRIPVGDTEWQGSISVGVASRTPLMNSYDVMIKTADEGVYAAKRAGRNCTRTTAFTEPELALVTARPERPATTPRRATKPYVARVRDIKR